MKTRVIFAFILAMAGNLFAALPADYQELKSEAEKFYSEDSFARAHELYEQVNVTNLPPDERRWVEFRRADTQWRSEAATETADTAKLDEAQHQLEVLVRDVTREEDHDRVWAEVEESLGDFFWTRRNQQNWGAALPYYQNALGWWAGSSDIELARRRYLAMVWRMAQPARPEPYMYYGYWGNYVPLDILENALKITQTDNDKAHAHYLIAMTLRNRGGNWDRRARVPEEFQGAIAVGKTTDWYDDALYNYAEWMMNQGRFTPLENGAWQQEPDYVKALELFRKLTSEYKKGETRYWDQAQQQIRNITDPQVSVSVANIFLPDSEIQYSLNWRNVKRIDLAIYPVQLNDDVQFPAKSPDRTDWLQSIDLRGKEKIKSWTRETNDKGDYKPGSDSVHLDEKLKPGAYVIEASGGGKSARDMILVTDTTLVLKASGKQALAYVCNALNGAPVPGAKIKLWERWWEDDRNWHSQALDATARTNGIAVFDLTTGHNRNRELFASTIKDDRQSFSLNSSYWYQPDRDSWRIYAFTDRPAYRPKETVHWKFTARRYDGSIYSTPADQTIEFEITDPRGGKVKSDKATLNAFGSAWGDLELTDKMPLGEYRITFWDDGRHNVMGNATLFRLEEYKLPEFKVTVKTPEENGRKKAFRLGDTVEATIQADYYFGGPVANATVQVLVHQNPYWHVWHEPRQYPWLYEDMDNPNGRWGRWYGGGQIITNATIKTDATGKATLSFETPASAGQDFEYQIEARVTDASRREITGTGTVRVTRQRYYVYAEPDHNLYRPQDKVQVNFKALDANEQPAQTEGEVKVTRDYWFEIWLAPDGHEVKGAELKRLQSENVIWPPPPARPDERDWKLKFRGYEHDDILTRTLKTDTNGAAELKFTPERTGYYRVSWTSDERASGILPEDQVSNGSAGGTLSARSVHAETTVWVANNRTTELGYRTGGVEIIADKDTFRVGRDAPIMLVAPTSDRYVLFTVEGEDLYNYQLVHLDGTVKLIELPIEEKHVPNIFLNATLVSDRQIFTDSKQIVVPPVKNFLTVDVTPDREQYLPRGEGTLTVTTKNDEGEPVSAEVALGLVDESVYYIQNDYAGDPRQFYFGEKRSQRVQTQSTMNQKSYARLVQWKDNELIDDRDKERIEEAQKQDVNMAVPAGGGFGGGGAMLGPERRPLNFGRMAAANGAVDPSTGLPLSAMSKAEAMDSLGIPAATPPPTELEAPEKEPAVVVRSDFRSTVFWQPDVHTGKDGKATVKLTYPDSLTSWKATARAFSEGNQFGMAVTNTRTRQPLIVRLEAPRFFVVGDTVTISAVVNNNTDDPVEANVSLDAAGLKAEQASKVSGSGRIPELHLTVPANGEARADWVASVENPGEIKLKVTARGGDYSDAMEKTFTAYEHGIEKFISKSGKVRGDDVTVKLALPHDRKDGSTSLNVRLTPSLAVTMLDALPYLIDYPYGCIEQTMSRFLPATITAKTLRDLGLKPEDVMGRVFGGIETNSATATHPNDKKDLDELNKIEKAGLDRLYDFQHGDGGWGWWKQGDSDHWMTAYVVWGLSLARDAGVDVKADVLRSGISYLDKELVEEEDNYDMQAFMLHALAASGGSKEETKFQQTAFDNLWNNREKLNAYTRALLALAAHDYGKSNEARILIENLENGVKRDERPDTSVLIKADTSHPAPETTVMGTAHWGEDGIYWRWSDGGVEATAFALRALMKIDPTNSLVEPVTNWLIKNRRGAQWDSTRSTAIVILALNDYLRASGELKTDLEYELTVNGHSIDKKRVTPADVFTAPSRFQIDPDFIRDTNEIQIKRVGGNGPIYFAVESKFFSTEEPITPAGNEIFVKRQYYKLVSRPTLLKGYVYDKEPLNDGESVKSGERIQTVLTIEAKNNYEYLMFEDLKPAGFEAAEVRSGESLYANELKSGAVERNVSKTAGELSGLGSDQADFTGRTRWVYQELRDRKVALFLDKLPQGLWQIRYEMRAEVPGKFHALPVVGQAMYVPEIRCNGAEARIRVEEANAN